MKKWRIGYYWVIVEDPSIDNSYTKKYSEELNNRLNIVWYGLNWI